jgi:hypothetical protein
MTQVITIEQNVLANIVPTHNGVDVPLTKEQKEIPLYHQYLSTNPLLSDVQWEAPKREQTTADIPVGRSNRPRVQMEDASGEERGITDLDGMILDFEGYPTGVFGFVNNTWVDEEQVETYEDNTGDEAARAVRWSFYLRRVRLTDGPLQRDLQFKTDEQKADLAKADMFGMIGSAIAEAFKQAGLSQAPSPNGVPILEGQEKGKEVLENMDMSKLVEELQSRYLSEGKEEVNEEEARLRVLDSMDMTQGENATLLHDGEKSEDEEQEEEISVEEGSSMSESEEDLSVVEGVDPIEALKERHTTV